MMEAMAEKHSSRRDFVRSMIITGGALCLWAAWAAWANHDHGDAAARQAAWTQVGLSLFITLFMTNAVDAITRMDISAIRQWLYALAGPSMVVLLSLVAVHTLAGTPNILLTITPSVIVGFVYCSLYTMWRNRSTD